MRLATNLIETTLIIEQIIITFVIAGFFTINIKKHKYVTH